jgi:cytochrome c2
MQFLRRGEKALLVTGLCLATAALPLAQAPAKNASAQKSGGGSPASPAEIEQGKKHFNTRCAICHYSASPAKKIGPGLRGLAKRGTYADGKPVDDASLREWIEKGSKNMPGFKAALNAEQIRELVVYLKTL